MNKITVIILLALMAGCSRVPDRLYNPTAVFRAEIKDNSMAYTIYIKGTLFNEQTEKIYKNIKGTIIISSNDRDILTIPFEVPVLMPLQKYTVNAEFSGNETDMSPVFALLQVNLDQLKISDQMAYSNEQPIKPDNIKLKIDSYSTENIIDIIKGKQQ
jgi:hypothetical protein